jgi:hypothetical protein
MEPTTNPQEKSWKTNWKRRIILNALALVGIILLSRVFDNQKQFNRAMLVFTELCCIVTTPDSIIIKLLLGLQL